MSTAKTYAMGRAQTITGTVYFSLLVVDRGGFFNMLHHIRLVSRMAANSSAYLGCDMYPESSSQSWMSSIVLISGNKG